MADTVYGVHCQTCARAATGTKKELRAAGWMDMPRKGKPERMWPWLCPEHKPKPPTSMGRSTT